MISINIINRMSRSSAEVGLYNKMGKDVTDDNTLCVAFADEHCAYGDEADVFDAVCEYKDYLEFVKKLEEDVAKHNADSDAEDQIELKAETYYYDWAWEDVGGTMPYDDWMEAGFNWIEEPMDAESLIRDRDYNDFRQNLIAKVSARLEERGITWIAGNRVYLPYDKAADKFYPLATNCRDWVEEMVQEECDYAFGRYVCTIADEINGSYDDAIEYLSKCKEEDA